MNVDRLLPRCRHNCSHTPAEVSNRLYYSRYETSICRVFRKKEELSKVFQRFYKVDKSRGLDAKGAGLGLYIVKMMVEMHSGTIYAQSEDENTAEFVFKLPKEYKPVYKKGDKQ